MTMLNAHATVGQWVAQHPSTARVFERLGIDYCCGGKKPLEEACRQQRLVAEEVLDQLQGSIGPAEAEEENWNSRSLADLCDHIEHVHHGYLRRELPRLTDLVAKVVNAHAGNHPELYQVQQAFAELRNELEPHMMKEERVLFPAIRALERSPASQSFPFGSVANPIHMMEHEHDHAGQCLASIHELTRNYEIPEGACNTYRVMLASLQELEGDMHQHVHKENNILFPRACELETHGVA